MLFRFFCIFGFLAQIYALDSSFNEARIDETKNGVDIVIDRAHLLNPKSVFFLERLGNELYEKSAFLLGVALITDTNEAIREFRESDLIDEKLSAEFDNLESSNNSKKSAVAQISLFKNGFKNNLARAISRDNALSSSSAVSKNDGKSLTPKDYVFIVFFVDLKKIEFIYLDEKGERAFDEDQVFFEYMAPLLPKNNEVLDSPRISAIILNGYAQAADLVAQKYGVELLYNMPKDEKGAREFVKFSMYGMMMILLLVVAFVYFGSKFHRKN